MVDFEARRTLAEVIRHYLNEELTAFQFDDLLQPFYENADSTVQAVSKSLWHLYDDCDDHLVVADKPTWDYVQRLLLLLESGWQIDVWIVRQWSVRQFVAGFLLLCCIGIAYQVGMGWHLIPLLMPFGVLSIIVSQLGSSQDRPDPFEKYTTPFRSISELERAYRSARKFRKSRYPKHLAHREIRNKFISGIYLFKFYLLWVLFPVIPLMLQCLPRTSCKTSILPASLPTQ